MLTDSGVNAMSDKQLVAMIEADDSYAGSATYTKLENKVKENGPERIAFVRLEAGTNQIGGQPISLENMKAVRKVCDKYDLMLVMDSSLLADNLYFIKTREAAYKDKSIREINKEISDLCDIIYFSARKLGHARGGGIITNSKEAYMKMRELITLFEGFLTYGVMSVREIEAITVGLEETMDEDMISQGPLFTEYMVKKLTEIGVPVVTLAGGLGCHIDATAFLDHVPQGEYPAGALASAMYIASGVRGMERGTISEERNPDGSDHYSNMELLRLALPRRVFTLSQVDYVIDRLHWLYENRKLIGGLKFVEEPKILRFFFGKLLPTGKIC